MSIDLIHLAQFAIEINQSILESAVIECHTYDMNECGRPMDSQIHSGSENIYISNAVRRTEQQSRRCKTNMYRPVFILQNLSFVLRFALAIRCRRRPSMHSASSATENGGESERERDRIWWANATV